MARITISSIVDAKRKAAAGVDYTSRFGAVCPWCGHRTKVYKTMAWEDDIRIRYHLCGAARCAIAALGTSIKSVEVY